MKNKWKTSAGLAFSLMLLVGCDKKSDLSGVNYELSTLNRTATVSRTTGLVTWNSGYASASEIKFQAKKADLKVEYKSKVGQKIDLFSTVSTLGIVSMPPGSYKKIELKISLVPTATDASFELSGTHGSTPLTFRVTEAFDIKTEKEGQDIADGTKYTAATSMNLSLLTSGITQAMLNNATLTNGTLLISSTSNSNLYAIMLQNLENLDDCKFK